MNVARLSPAAVLRLPQATDGTVIKSFDVSPGVVEFIAPASDAVPGRFWGRKILSGRLADPARPGEINVSFTLAQRLHLRAGGSLRLVMQTAAGHRVPFVFRIATRPKVYSNSNAGGDANRRRARRAR